ncbi:tetratricopeptide repeat protein [Vitiosangium sp. GDMCC 1.1324]|uniref:serine/threonine-protein kinase n=1 Tax=Vitiosangium sp. (strain GDMCC 1.1324) TaxID=2138576 RepID=UPI000D37A6D8|nr:serine/threonine-protein kinase [Vitiosangium sp. GDMCC 1.1324]PTL79198.1 serine/threonine protein kinase [Vitiosangium sp. GDMCC 1.1324]
MKDVEPRAKGDSGTGATEEEHTLVRNQASVPPGSGPGFDPLGDAATQVRSLVSPLPSRDPLTSAPRLYGPVSTVPGQMLVGRYTVLNPLGRGGMGEVVAAYDSRLDRRVALKLLRQEWDSSQSQHDMEARMLREAQAMARLSHPNVVAIYDVGTLEGGAIFIAMEMVEGLTLRRWCEQAPRTWREILTVFLAAGRGLAAAHEAGLVHRDFKPENVLVGKDGRVRVTDFGLARAESSSTPPGPATTPVPLPPGALDSPLTLQGTLLGTPRYMAPELLRAGSADARSDLFAFCVALYEALYRQHPFSGATQAESAKAQLEGRVKPPPADTQVPEWLAHTLLEGLRADPAQRPASMEKLVAALADDPEARRRVRRRAGALTALVAGLAGLTLWSWFQLHHQEPGCAHLERRLTGTWDEAVKTQMKQAFLGTKLPYAEDTFTHASKLLDGYAETWVRMRTEACEAAQNQDSSPQEPTVLQVYCLERRRGQMRALTELFARGPDRDNVSKAVQAVQSLPPLDACADARALKETVPLPKDPAVRAEVQALLAEVDRLEPLREAGKYREGLSSGEKLLPRVEKVGHEPLLAQALYQVAYLKDSVGDYAGAEAMVRQAIPMAARSKDLVLVARTWMLLFREVGWRQARYPEAMGLLLTLESAAELADDDAIRADALNDQAIAFQETGKYAEALARHERALKLRQKALGLEHWKVSSSLNNMGTVFGALGKNQEARDAYERALTIRRKSLGPNHPLVALSYSNLGTAAYAMGKYDEARDRFENALAIRKNALGLEHPDVASSRTNLGTAFEALGRSDEALAQYEQALAIREKLLEPNHPDIASTLNNLGSTLRGLGRYPEARARLERALAIQEKALGPEHPDVASTLTDLGHVLRAMKKYEEARSRYVRALAIQEKELGPEHPDIAVSLNGLGNVLRDLGKYEEARERHERALALREKALGPTHLFVAESLDSLGRTLVRLKRWDEARHDLERALALWEKESKPAPRGYAEGLLGMGELLLARGRAAEAVPQLERALELAPEDLRAEVRPVLEKARAASTSNASARTALAPVP